MNKKIIFITSFNTSPFIKASTTKEWNDYRFNFWLKWTYPSIMNQSYADVEYWLFCNDMLKEITEDYRGRIDDARCKIVYRGEMYKEIAKLKSYDYYVMPRIDSDDLYHKDLAQFLFDREIPKNKVFYHFTHGYAYDVNSKKLFYWGQGSSPFYAFIFDKTFPQTKFFWFIDHTNIRKFSDNIVKTRMFCVMIHDKNTTTNLSKGYVGKQEINKKIEILKDFIKDYKS